MQGGGEGRGSGFPGGASLSFFSSTHHCPKKCLCKIHVIVQFFLCVCDHKICRTLKNYTYAFSLLSLKKTTFAVNCNFNHFFSFLTSCVIITIVPSPSLFHDHSTPLSHTLGAYDKNSETTTIYYVLFVALALLWGVFADFVVVVVVRCLLFRTTLFMASFLSVLHVYFSSLPSSSKNMAVPTISS